MGQLYQRSFTAPCPSPNWDLGLAALLALLLCGAVAGLGAEQLHATVPAGIWVWQLWVWYCLLMCGAAGRLSALAAVKLWGLCFLEQALIRGRQMF